MTLKPLTYSSTTKAAGDTPGGTVPVGSNSPVANPDSLAPDGMTCDQCMAAMTMPQKAQTLEAMAPKMSPDHQAMLVSEAQKAMGN